MSIVADKIAQLRKEIDYQSILEECCNEVIALHNPSPTESILEYIHSQDRLEMIHVKVGEKICGIVVTGKISEMEDCKTLAYTKPYYFLCHTGDLKE